MTVNCMKTKNKMEIEVKNTTTSDSVTSDVIGGNLSTNMSTSSDLAEEDDMFLVDWFEWLMEGVLIFVVGNIGLLGNGVSIWTFSKQRVHRIFHNLLLVLALFDMVSLFCYKCYSKRRTFAKSLL